MGSLSHAGKLTAQADSTAQKMDIASLDVTSDWVVFLFQGDNSEEIELVGGSDEDSGYQIEAGERYISGPHRWRTDNASVWLHSNASDSVTVKVIEAADGISFRHTTINDNVDVDTINADIQTEGTYNETPPTVADGEREDIQLDSRGNTRVASESLFEDAHESDISITSSWQWFTYQPDWQWLVRSLTIFLQETSGNDNFSVQIYGTNKTNPPAPTGSDPDGWYNISEGEIPIPASGEDVVKHTGHNSRQIAVGLQDPTGSAVADFDLTMLSSAGIDAAVRALRAPFESVGEEIIQVDDDAIGDETNVVTQSTPGTNDNALNYISGNLSELQNIVSELQSQLSVDISGASAAPIGVDDSDVGDSANVSTQQTSGGTGSVLNYLSGIMQTIQDAWASVGNEIFQVSEQNVVETVQRLVADGTYAPVNFTDETGTDNVQVTANQCVLKQAYCLVPGANTASQPYYFQLWDGGTSGTKRLTIPANASAGDAILMQFDAGEDQISFGTDLTLAVSTTPDSFTALGNGENPQFYAFYQD